MLIVRQRYGRTDGQTDGRTTYDSNTALALRASRGKNKSAIRISLLPFRWTEEIVVVIDNSLAAAFLYCNVCTV